LNNQGFTLIELMVIIALIGIILGVTAPVTRDALTTNSLKKAARQLIGLERKLRVEAVRDQIEYVLLLDIVDASYWVITSDMTPEKQAEVKTNAKKFPAGITVLDIIKQNNEKITEGVVKIKFGKNGLAPPLIIHLAEDEERMTLTINPFLGVTAVYDRYVDVAMADGLGRDAQR
jgi:prepilin-type N-terminal cleavage/methylation domain-containing protein